MTQNLTLVAKMEIDGLFPVSRLDTGLPIPSSRLTRRPGPWREDPAAQTQERAVDLSLDLLQRQLWPFTQVTCPKEKEIPGPWGITRGWLWTNANSWDISVAEEQTSWLNNGYLS